MAKDKTNTDEKTAGDVAAPEVVAATDEQEIIVKDPQVLRPVELPLVITLPDTASKAQKKYAATLNAYAYQNPEKWAVKKDTLIAKLRDLKNAPDPVDGPLTIGTRAPANVL